MGGVLDLEAGKSCQVWVRKTDVITVGGDPCWMCPKCGGDAHVVGVETEQNAHHRCKECGNQNLYPWEEEDSKKEP